MQTTEPKDVGPGTRLGRYEILLGIAQGGMARVWAARQHGQRGFSKIVAIKTILPALASDPEFEAMFLDEARVAAGVHHPNVCEIFDLGEEQGVLYLAMEWVNGESLARVLKSGPPATPGGPATSLRLGARIAAHIVADAGGGLHAAHELCDDAGNRLSVVHRDVSPQNILLSIDGTLKVTDFGVAKALGSAHQSTAAGQIKGKAAYLSPEQAAGGRVDRRSDVFALGVVLYELTTGVRPFSGENQVTMIKRLLEGRFEPPGAQLPGYPRDLEAIVMRAMALDPMQRFPTTDRMRVALEEWLARSGPVVTETQVAAAVRERVGGAVEERTARIRERMRSTSLEPPSVTSFPPPSDSSSVQSSTSSTATAGATYVTASGVPSSTSSIRPSLAVGSSGATTALLGIGLGLSAFMIIALAIGGGWLYLRARATPTAGGTVPSSAVVVPTAPPGFPESTVIALRPIAPREGLRYELDGDALPARTVGLARPKPGQVRFLTARAAGYEEKVIRVDEHSPDVLEVKLTESAPVDAASASSGHLPVVAPVAPGSPRALADAGFSGPRPERKKKSIQADIPENPF